MKNLREYTSYLNDMRRQHDISSRRYYNRDSEAIILKLITEELSKITHTKSLPRNLYLSLAQIDQNSSIGIETLCKIYRKIISFNLTSLVNELSDYA